MPWLLFLLAVIGLPMAAALAFCLMGERLVLYPPRPQSRQQPQGGEEVFPAATAYIHGWYFL